MAISFSCPCGKSMRVRDEASGKKVRCPGCQKVIVVPQLKQANASNAPVQNSVTCQYCHQQIPKSQYSAHVQQHTKLQADGQQNDYATLPPDQRSSSFDIANEPRNYVHQKCGVVTIMPEEIVATYLENPWFYLADKSFCCGCNRHVKQSECTWTETGENVQAYCDRLRATRPDLMPPLWQRMLAGFFKMF